MQLPLKAVEAKRKRVGRGNNNIFSLQYPNLARENTNTTPHLKPGFLNASAKYQMQSPECSVNHLQPPDNQGASRAGSEQQEASLFTDPNASSPVFISHHSAFSFTLFALSQSSTSRDSAGNNMGFHPCLSLLMAQLLTGMVLSNCPAKSFHTYNSSPTCCVALLLHSQQIHFFTINVTFPISSIHSSLSGSCQRLLSLKSLF